MAKTLGIVLSVLLFLGAGALYLVLQQSPKEEVTSNVFGFQYATSSIPNEALLTSEATGTAQVITTNKNIMQATLHTTQGDITIEFFTEDAPKTVENFIKLAQSGFYDGTKFHRVIAGFMVQGGDPLTKDDAAISRWGTGGPGYQFADEIHANNKNEVGTIAMANAGPNTNGSQFFLNTASNNFLDSKHTVFGRIVSGMEVVRAIEALPTDAGDRPTSPVVIQSVTLK